VLAHGLLFCLSGAYLQYQVHAYEAVNNNRAMACGLSQCWWSMQVQRCLSCVPAVLGRSQCRSVVLL